MDKVFVIPCSPSNTWRSKICSKNDQAQCDYDYLNKSRFSWFFAQVQIRFPTITGRGAVDKFFVDAWMLGWFGGVGLSKTLTTVHQACRFCVITHAGSPRERRGELLHVRTFSHVCH